MTDAELREIKIRAKNVLNLHPLHIDCTDKLRLVLEIERLQAKLAEALAVPRTSSRAARMGRRGKWRSRP